MLLSDVSNSVSGIRSRLRTASSCSRLNVSLRRFGNAQRVATHQHARQPLRPPELPCVQVAQQRVARLDDEAAPRAVARAVGAADRAGMRGREEGLAPGLDVGAVTGRVDL